MATGGIRLVLDELRSPDGQGWGTTADEEPRKASSDMSLPTAVRTSEADWRATRTPGVAIKMLREDPATGGSSFLVRLEPGARIPAHDHPGGEELFVVDGDFQVGPERLSAGDYLYTPPDGKH